MRSTHIDVIRQVIRYLGMCAVIMVTGVVLGFGCILWLSKGKGTVDVSVAAIFASLTGLAGTALGGLGSMLVSTSSTNEDQPQQVTVEQAPGSDPLLVEPVVPGTTV